MALDCVVERKLGLTKVSMISVLTLGYAWSIRSNIAILWALIAKKFNETFRQLKAAENALIRRTRLNSTKPQTRLKTGLNRSPNTAAPSVPANSIAISSKSKIRYDAQTELASWARPLSERSEPNSLCEDFLELIQKVQQRLSIQRIYQDMPGEVGFHGSYHSVRQFVFHLAEIPLPFRWMEAELGDKAQIDFGSAALVVGLVGKSYRP